MNIAENNMITNTIIINLIILSQNILISWVDKWRAVPTEQSGQLKLVIFQVALHKSVGLAL
jgi:hypothetical protein